MGEMEIDFDSEENVEFADASMEMVSYYAILASSDLAEERGTYKSYKGSKWEQDIHHAGYKFHMNNINALIGLEQLKHVDRIIASHKRNAAYFEKNINTDLVKKTTYDAGSAYWIYTVLVDDPNKFKEEMATAQILTDVVHVRNDKYSVMKPYDDGRALPGVDEFCSKMICIPVGWWLTDNDREYIVDKVNNYKG